MDRNSLQQQSNLAAQNLIESQIQELKKDLTQLKKDYRDIIDKKFQEHYGCSVEDTYHAYGTRLASCCGQGGTGYAWWLPSRREQGMPFTYHPGYCHCVVLDYEKAQPTQQELDAYWVIFGKEMQITKNSHTERWGN